MLTKVLQLDILKGKEFFDKSGGSWGAIEGDENELVIKKVNGAEQLTVTFLNGQVVDIPMYNPIPRFQNIQITYD